MLPTNTRLQDRYRIINPLGTGGMGAVYEALDERLQITVALKETLSTDDKLRRQFEREAQMLAQLHHPALPRVSDHFVEGDRAFLVMQYISGVDLAAVLAQQPGPFPANQVIAWADQLLDALVYLHSRDRKIIHRDIKPHNLKLAENGRIVLLDFGLAKRHAHGTSDVSSAVSIFGYTRCYAPLEQIQHEGTTPQSDIYALGATLYHLLTGLKPADALARAAALISGRPDPLRPANEINRDVGHELAALLNRAMEQNPDKRFPSAMEFREALRRLGRTDTAKQAVNQPWAKVEPSNVESEAEDEGTTVVKSALDLSTDAIAASNTSGQRTRGVVFAVTLVLLLIGGGVLASYYGLKRGAGTGIGTAAQTKNITVGAAAESSAPSDKRAPKIRPPNTPSNPPTNLLINVVSRTLPVAQLSRVSTNTSSPSRQRTGRDKAVSPISIDIRQPAAVAHRLESHRATNMPKPPRFRPLVPDYSSSPAVQSVSSLPTYAERRPTPDRKVLRSAEGIHVVKFADGSTRVFRPGERISAGGER